jgi:EmrB/QacA subfamily drug resistance transporter
METLDGTVIATALPQMAATFRTNPVNLSIGMTSYLVTLAVFIPISGWVADRLGTRRVFAWAVAAFTLASVLCALSTSVAQFTAARVFQGMAGAMMVPVGRLAVLRNTGKEDLVRAMAFIVWPGLIAPVIGPPLGGFLATYLSWQWIFLLNVPLGVAGIFLIRAYIPESAPQPRRPLDTAGFALSGLALSFLMVGVELLGYGGRWQLGALLVAGSIALGVALAAHLRRHPHPLIDPTIMAVPSFRTVMIGGTIARTAISAMPFLLPLLFQVGFGLNAFEAGMLYLASMLGNLGMKLGTTQALRRFGFRNVLVFNGALAGASIALCAVLSPDTPVPVVVAIMLVCGLTRSMQFTGLTSMAFAEVPHPQMSSANTLFSTTQQMSMGLGIAVGAVVLHLTAAARDTGGAIYDVTDFRITFLVVGLLALSSLLSFVRLRHDAGAEVSGHRRSGGTA